MTTPVSLLAPKATPFLLRETTIQKIYADGVHSADNKRSWDQVTTPGSLLSPKATPFLLRETTVQKISIDGVHSADNIFWRCCGDKVQFPDFEDYASLTFVGDYIADSSSHMATPRRDRALVLL